jgi:hypothetical protein
MYKKCFDQMNQKEATSVIRTTDGACIPFDPANTDAIEFAKWLSEGGIPEPAVEGETVSAEWIAETIAKLS